MSEEIKVIKTWKKQLTEPQELELEILKVKRKIIDMVRLYTINTNDRDVYTITKMISIVDNLDRKLIIEIINSVKDNDYRLLDYLVEYLDTILNTIESKQTSTIRTVFNFKEEVRTAVRDIFNK